MQIWFRNNEQIKQGKNHFILFKFLFIEKVLFGAFNGWKNGTEEEEDGDGRKIIM